MPVCPFCKGHIAADLLRFGGNCPHCLIEIPGEEAPTDPGDRAKAQAEAEESAAHRSRRVPAIAAAVVVLCGAGGAGAWVAMQPEQPARIDLGNEDFYVVPLSAHRDVNLPTDLDVAPKRPRPRQLAQAGAASEGPSLRGASLRAQRDEPATGGTLADTGRPVAEGSVVPRSLGQPAYSADLGTVGARVTRTNLEGVVLKDPAEISRMAKQVIGGGSGQLRQCYESRLKQKEDLKGSWKVSIRLGRSTTPAAVKVTGIDMPDSELESCIERQVASWMFVPIAEPLEVDKVFKFDSTGSI